MNQIPEFRTIGKLARELNTSISRINYVLGTRAHIKPTARAGRLRLFDRKTVALIRHELNAISARHDARRGGVHER